jgi:hypothetical protein
MYLRWLPFLTINDNAPSKIEILMLDLDEPTKLQEWQTIAWMVNNLAKIGRHLIQLLPILIILSNQVLIRNHY